VDPDFVLKVSSDPIDGDARKVVDAIRDQIPAGGVNPAAHHSESMAAAELLIIALSHVTVMGLIEGTRLVWDMYRAPVKVELPNGAVVILKGAPDDLVVQLRVLVENLKQTAQSAETTHELDELLKRLKTYATAG